MPTIDMLRISTLAPEELREADVTPGLLREVAFATDRALQIRARADGGTASGWHHHGDREVLGYLARGRAQMEFGPGGRERAEVVEGGFLHVPAGLVHRDVNPGDEPHEWILVFVGGGPLVVNVDGPEPA